MGAMLAFMPFAYGAVHASSELIVLVGATALCACVLLRAIFDAESNWSGTWLTVPIALLLLLFVLQLAPLPVSLASMLSANTVATKAELLDDVPTAMESIPKVSLSFYPWETAHSLRLSLVAATFFVVAATAFTTSRAIKRILTVIFAVGVAQAILALLQILSMAKSIYWIDAVAGSRVVKAGSFVNYSNFSQFMNLSIGAGLALLIVRLHEDRQRRKGQIDWRHTAGVMWWEDTRWLIGGIVLCAVSIFTSMSRNGAVSLTVAAGVVGTALYLRGSLSRRGWLLAVVPLGALLVLLLTAFDPVYARLATLQDEEHLFDRWEMTLATLAAWRAFPIWGAGLGTHEYVFSMFDTAVSPDVAAHADNDYAQLLEETGIVGTLLLGLFLGGVAVLGIRLMRKGTTPLSTAAFGLMFGLIAVGFHSATDFGQRLPANFCITAIFCGLMASIWRLERRSSAETSAPEPGRLRRAGFRFGVACVGLIVALGVWGWAIRDAYATFIGEKWQVAAFGIETVMGRDGVEPTDQDYRDLLFAWGNAFDADPTNVKTGYWLNQYRWIAMSRNVDPATGNVMLSTDSLPVVERIADEVSQVRGLCATYGPPCVLEGELRFKWLEQKERGAELIQQGYRLARYYAPACAAAGELAAREGDLDRAAELLNRSVALAPSYFRSTVEYYLQVLKRPDLARQLAGDDYRRIQYVADAAQRIEEYRELAEGYQLEAIEQLREVAASDDATARDLASLASIEARSGNAEAAVDLYKQALVSDYGNVGWRLALARAMADAGQYNEAMSEARLCLKFRPQHAGAMRLIEQLSVQPGVEN